MPALPADGVLKIKSVSSCNGNTDSVYMSRTQSERCTLHQIIIMFEAGRSSGMSIFPSQGSICIPLLTRETGCAKRTPHCWEMSMSGQFFLLGIKPIIWLEHTTSITDFRLYIALPLLLPGYQGRSNPVSHSLVIIAHTQFKNIIVRCSKPAISVLWEKNFFNTIFSPQPTVQYILITLLETYTLNAPHTNIFFQNSVISFSYVTLTAFKRTESWICLDKYQFQTPSDWIFSLSF